MSLEAGFRIGAREVFPLEGRISGPAGNLRVEPKAMAVLVELARRAPEVCTRDGIVEKVWPRGYVSDDALTRCVGQLRRALGDDPRDPMCLQTIPKRGYRLLAAVTAIEPAGRPGALAVASTPVESLMVLPFQVLSRGGEELVADGLTELLTLRLAGLERIRVVSRTTAMQFKAVRADIGEIAARTGADWLVEGSVLQSGDRLQVVAQLIDARTDAHLWAADFVRDLGDLLDLQNQIAAQVAGAIRRRLGAAPAPSPLSSQAMRAYLRGRHRISRRTLPELEAARADFREVISQHPDHAPGWAGLAESEMLLAHYGAPDPAGILADCDLHIDRALSLDPDLAITLATRGAVRFFFSRDLGGARRDLERALVLLPSYVLAMVSLANVHSVQREFAEAAAWLEQALLVEPLDVGVNMNLGDHAILRRDYAAAVQALTRALDLVPDHRPSQLRLSWARALAGDTSGALASLDAIGPTGANDVQWHEYAALVSGATGDTTAARQRYRTLLALNRDRSLPGWVMARSAAAAGEVDAAFQFLRRAVDERSSSLPFLCVTPAFDALHADPRFESLCAELGLQRPRT